jgi:hypothetical protein
MAALTLWVVGYADQALQRSLEALGLAQELAQPAGAVFPAVMLGWPRKAKGHAAIALLDALLGDDVGARHAAPLLIVRTEANPFFWRRACAP